MGRGPVLTHGKGDNSLFHKLRSNFKELIPCLGSFHAPFFKIFRNKVKNVGAMNVYRNRPDSLFGAEQAEEILWEGVKPVFFFEKPGQIFHTVSHNPSADELLAGVDLEGIGRIAAEHSRLENCLGVYSGSSCNGGIDHSYIRILGLIERDQSLQSRAFVPGPPGENLQLALDSGTGCRTKSQNQY